MNIPRLTLLADLISEFLVDTEQALAALDSGLPRGPITGLHRIDESFGGFLAPGLHILQAAPGAGKSAFSLQVSSRCSFPALYVTAEMSVLELFRRLISRETKTYLGKLKTGELGVKEANRLALETVQKLPHLAILDGTSGYASPQQIYEIVEALKEKAGSSQVLVVIDSIQVWAKTVRGVDSELAGLSEYELINQRRCFVVDVIRPKPCFGCLIEIDREIGPDPTSCCKGSGEVEYLAESVIDLTRKDEQPDINGEVEVNLKVLKNRHGIPGVNFPLKFCGRLQTFREDT